MRKIILVLLTLFVVPIGISAVKYWTGDRSVNWQGADRSSAGLLPPAAEHPGALVRVFAARTVRWRGIFAVHSWIVFKEAGAKTYTRYDYTAWGDPIRLNGFAADGRWFGEEPMAIASADGASAEEMIPRIKAAIAGYSWRSYGDYRAWPGPNSNTFVAAVLAAVPELQVTLPPTAIGKDFPYEGGAFGWTPSGTGVRATLGGYLGLTVGWIEGVELNVLGIVLGFDIRRPAIKLPAIGRLGMSV
ncbi:DUF3750 domain-containing protein [Rhodopseudomonas boonkerdii]|uniref:DUF3750 domain-containing protein n=1 Tax=Rhodopseudomonas boonkerdii TaxID=475937 RepID=UPI003221AED1